MVVVVVDVVLNSERFAHESSLGEANPPLGRFVRFRIENFFAETKSSLLPKLRQETGEDTNKTRLLNLFSDYNKSGQ